MSNLFIKSCLSLIIFSSSLSLKSQIPADSSYRVLSPRFFPGWQAQNVSHPFVIQDKTTNQYKMYYCGSSSTQVNESLWDQWVTGVVTSENTLDWKYPDDYEQVLFSRKLMEGDVINPKEAAKTFDSEFAVDACVIKDESVYKCWYTGWNGEIEQTSDGLSKKINYRIGYATSPDGINWTKVQGTAGGGSVLGIGKPGENDAFGVEDPYVIKENGLYKMWYGSFDGKARKLNYATSTDGMNWTKKGLVFNQSSKTSLDELGEHNPVVIKRMSKYEIWYQGKSSSSPNYHLLRAVSNDGINWTKVGEIKLHPISFGRSLFYWPSMSPDIDGKIIPGSIIVHPDNSCQIFYAREFNTIKKATYGKINIPHLLILTERVKL